MEYPSKVTYNKSMPFIGDGHIWIIIGLIIVLIIFGPGKLPELGGAIGRGIREFKQSMSEITGNQPHQEAQANVQEPQDPTSSSGPNVN